MPETAWRRAGASAASTRKGAGSDIGGAFRIRRVNVPLHWTNARFRQGRRVLPSCARLPNPVSKPRQESQEPPAVRPYHAGSLSEARRRRPSEQELQTGRAPGFGREEAVFVLGLVQGAVHFRIDPKSVEWGK